MLNVFFDIGDAKIPMNEFWIQMFSCQEYFKIMIIFKGIFY